ncbi:hypothetical protein AKJ09_05532 [Labilithrix luteola]|uniref:Type IV fimbrial biogenesis protein PilY1 n=1 Tax=Labilithrix luteola TaxID=1391654 RepID=A0A0K1PZB4_9BACT|nr:hypothetical protein [Labilithrix luteola]AKU98868.1 hypothetical protein AKJ09_05532 [Labilithrix luteola]
MSHFVNFGKAKSALPVFVLLASSVTATLVACSSSDTTAGDGTPSTTGEDSGSPSTVVPEAASPDANDSSVDEASTDAGSDADADFDAAPRTCSNDNFCYSTVPAGENLRGVWGDGHGVVWTISTSGDVLRWDGNAWNVQATGLGNLTAISGTSPTDVWVVNAAGAVYHGTGANPAALTFAPVTFPGDATLVIKYVGGSSPTDVWAVGGKQVGYPYVSTGRALHFDGTLDDTGAPVWTADADLAALPNMYTRVSVTPGGGVVLVGSSSFNSTTGMYRGSAKTGTVVRRAPGGSTWITEDIPTAVPDAPPYPATFIAASVNNDGSLWLIGNSAFGSGRFRWLGTTADNGQTYKWTASTQYSWDPAATGVWGAAGNDAWEIGSYGHMQHWDGTTWLQASVMVTSAPLSKTFYAIWGTSSHDFWAVGDELAIHKTTANKP